MLMKTAKTTKQVPVNVISLKWSKPVSDEGLAKGLGKLPCKACRKPIKGKRWGMAWAEDKKGKYPMRLCEKCGEKAEQALKG